METRANHVLIGAFATAVVLAAFVFVMWLGRFQVDRAYNVYDIIFEGSVTGLGLAGDVRYNGIKVGEVMDLKLKDHDPNKVRVRVRVDADAPVSADTVATLEFMGVTGVSYVLLAGGNAQSQPLVKKTGEEHAVIPSKTSSLQDLFSGAPQLITRANEFAAKLNLILDEENRQSIRNILKNAETLTGTLALSGASVQRLVTNLDAAAANINALSGDLKNLALHTDSLVDKDVRELIARASRTAETSERVAAELEIMVRENRENITDFTRNGLGDVTRLAAESRELIRTLDRVANRLESDPSSLIYGASAPEREVQ